MMLSNDCRGVADLRQIALLLGRRIGALVQDRSCPDGIQAVRISWLMLARKSDLVRLDSSAIFMAFRVVSSARLRSVMSRTRPTNMRWPWNATSVTSQLQGKGPLRFWSPPRAPAAPR